MDVTDPDPQPLIRDARPETAGQVLAELDRIHACPSPEQLHRRLAGARPDLEDAGTCSQGTDLLHELVDASGITWPPPRIPVGVAVERVASLPVHSPVEGRFSPCSRAQAMASS